MTYKSVLLHVQGNVDGQQRLRCAHDLAESFGALLIGMGAEAIAPIATGAMGGFVQMDAYPALAKMVAEDLVAAEAEFWAAAEGLANGAVWKRGIDYPGTALAKAARSADLIVASGLGHGQLDPYRDAPAAELVMASGRPVLIVPAGVPALNGDKVLVAWQDTREARRAVTDALPFLQRAKAVRVLELCDADDHENAKVRAGDVVESLIRHGVAAAPLVADQSGRTADEILRQAKSFGADLIVAGAYGHSRIGEWAFGGVTRDLLRQDQAYVLLSH